MKKAFNGYDHGTGPIMIEHKNRSIEMMPVEIHHKSDGSADDKPSFAIVLQDGLGNKVIGQISLKMLNEGLSDIGYEIIRPVNNDRTKEFLENTLYSTGNFSTDQASDIVSDIMKGLKEAGQGAIRL